VREFLLFLSRIIATIFHCGYLPLAPGTWASAIALLAGWYLLPHIDNSTFFISLVILFFAGVLSSRLISEEDNDEDPSYVVIDEWVGMWIPLIGIPHNWEWWAAGFVLFRIFDIIKPFPIGKLEKLKGGWGIMLDDVLAGVYALVLIQITFRIV